MLKIAIITHYNLVLFISLTGELSRYDYYFLGFFYNVIIILTWNLVFGDDKHTLSSGLNESLAILLINTNAKIHKFQGPVVQSIVSLTSSFTGQLVKCFQLYYQIQKCFLWKK